MPTKTKDDKTESLTLDELDLIFTYCEADTFQEAQAKQLRFMRAMVYVLKRRSEPGLSIADIGPMTLKDAAAFIADGA